MRAEQQTTIQISTMIILQRHPVNALTSTTRERTWAGSRGQQRHRDAGEGMQLEVQNPVPADGLVVVEKESPEWRVVQELWALIRELGQGGAAV